MMSFDEREDIERKLELLMQKKYGVNKADFTEEDEASLQATYFIKFGNSGHISQNHKSLGTPMRKSPNTLNAPSTVSSMTSNDSENTFLSKASSGLLKVLAENRAMKTKFQEVKIKNIEKQIFNMDADFVMAAEFHATFLLFIK
jgi:hypothetical protein